MMVAQPMRPPWRALLVAVSAALICLAGCGGSQDSGTTETSESAASIREGTTAKKVEVTASGDDPAPTDEVKLWFMVGEQYLPVEREVEAATDDPGAVAGPREATEALLEGPKPGDAPAPVKAAAKATGGASPKLEIQTTIPPDTELIDLEVGEDGQAKVELSPEFLDGIPAQAKKRSPQERRELSARVGQVVYTVTQFAGISSAEVQSGGITVSAGKKRSDYAPPPKRRPPSEPLRPGAPRSAATRQLQLRLIELRYLPKGSADGVYGDATAQAVMAFQAWEGLDRDGIAGPATHKALAKAKVPKPQGSGPKRRVEVHLDKGVVLLVRGGRTRRAIHASSGAPGYDTPRGSFEVYRKELMSWSVPYSVWMPYASYFTGGIALHEAASVPPYPASHGCVRIPSSEAKLVYNFATLGTAVEVL